jgi:hypothetical protein
LKPVVIDTNVAVAANGRNTHASVGCAAACARLLQSAMQSGSVVIDDRRLILSEYLNNLRSIGQPGAGDAFLKWILINNANSARCVQISITETGRDDLLFVELALNPELLGFDRPDQKFLAVAIAHPDKPQIINATDSDWVVFFDQIARLGIEVVFLCPAECSP